MHFIYDLLSITATQHFSYYILRMLNFLHHGHDGLQLMIDGPKWVCDPHRIKKLALDRKAKDPNHPGCVVYSIGSNGDFTFEMGVQHTVGVGVCEFHIFDFGNFESKIPRELKRANYHRWGLGKQLESATKSDSSSPVVQTGDMILYGLLDTIRKLGHEHLDVIDIFVSHSQLRPVAFHTLLSLLHLLIHFCCVCRKLIASLVSGIHTKIGYRRKYPFSIKFRWSYTVLRRRRAPEVQLISLTASNVQAI